MNKFFGQKSEIKEMNLLQVHDDDQTTDDQALTATNEEQTQSIDLDELLKQQQTQTQETEQTTQEGEKADQAAENQQKEQNDAETKAETKAEAKDRVIQATKNINIEQIANLKSEIEERQYSKMSKDDKLRHQEESRNEGIIQAQITQDQKNNKQSFAEISLEIEDPGAANKVAEEGAITINESSDFLKLSVQLNQARTKPENKLGENGFAIKFSDPSVFENTMKIIQMADANDEDNSIVQSFNMKDKTDTTQASVLMSSALSSDQGVVIVDTQPGKQSIIQNVNSDIAKTVSQIAAGFAIRKNQVLKMAPGDKQFHLVTWNLDKGINNMKTFQQRELADKAFKEDYGEMPRLLICGETGDVVSAFGDQNQQDQILGMFYTQRYQGKYYGRP